MAIHPINISRVSSVLQSNTLLSALRRNTAALFNEQNRLSTGRQFLTPSDDPGRAAKALNLNEILDQQSQLLTNIRHASNTLDATDLAMADVSSLIIDAQSIASQNIGSLASADERIAAAELVTSIRDQLMAVGNRTFEGRYLFAGRDTNSQPFLSVLGGVAYVGDTGDIFARTDVDQLDEINLAGNVLFGALSNEVLGWTDLTPVITIDTRLEDLNGALNEGIRLGSFQIVEDGAAGIVTVDLSQADTIGDVVDAINSAAADAGAGFTASLTDNGIAITPGGAAITIRDISTGTTAADLGITTTAATSTAVTGADLGVAMTRTTAISDLAGGFGIDLAGGLIITNGDRSATIDLSAAETVQDILNAINNSGLYVRAEINDARNGINVINQVSGAAMTIGENGGTTATDLGIRSMHGGTDVASLNNGEGLRTVPGETDIRINAKNGVGFEVNLDGVGTLGDIIEAINTAATAAGVNVSAGLTATGNGITLTDGTGGTGTFSVTRVNLSPAIDDLGLDKVVADPGSEIVGDDVNPVQPNGILSALSDLERALLNDDSQGISIAAEELDVHLNDFNRAAGPPHPDAGRGHRHAVVSVRGSGPRLHRVCDPFPAGSDLAPGDAFDRLADSQHLADGLFGVITGASQDARRHE
jgi:flagellar hook-associated protein 3 FlgL